MYICLCKGISDRDIRDAAEQGCASLHELRRELGVASQCARCARDARDLLREAAPAVEVLPPVGEEPVPAMVRPAAPRPA